jgi:hypothetical protein
VRKLPSAKVCFLGGAQALGGTKTPEGAPAKQKTAAPQGAALFAFAVLESEAGEKGSNKTTPLLSSVGRRRVGSKSIEPLNNEPRYGH